MMTTEELFAKLFGKTRKEAESIAELKGYALRVVRVDGKACVGTRDVKPNRINVHIVGGIVESHSGMG